MVKNITLSADIELIRKARQRAQQEHTSLNEEFRKWLQRYIGHNTKTVDYFHLMERLSYAQPGGIFTRDEMNER
ncbi:MAG: hypothetical protein ACE5I1_02240 [bacterium]